MTQWGGTKPSVGIPNFMAPLDASALVLNFVSYFMLKTGGLTNAQTEWFLRYGTAGKLMLEFFMQGVTIKRVLIWLNHIVVKAYSSNWNNSPPSMPRLYVSHAVCLYELDL